MNETDTKPADQSAAEPVQDRSLPSIPTEFYTDMGMEELRSRITTWRTKHGPMQGFQITATEVLYAMRDAVKNIDGVLAHLSSVDVRNHIASVKHDADTLESYLKGMKDRIKAEKYAYSVHVFGVDVDG